MAEGVRLSAAVVFVRNLEKSASFYQELLGLDVADRSTTAALLTSPGGSQLVLRQFGNNAPHPLGSIGVQYLLWSVSSKDDLDRRADILRRSSAYRETREDGNVTVVEGRDPDDMPVMILYGGGDQALPGKLPTRIYAW
ncbi:MAG TPA: VOC family protein [Streptosporangiaceae bacterium]|nr:VOC family protein [Streptosporangiaceae bacterium]